MPKSRHNQKKKPAGSRNNRPAVVTNGTATPAVAEQAQPVARQQKTSAEDYTSAVKEMPFVAVELKRIMLIAAVLIVILIVLSVVL